MDTRLARIGRWCFRHRFTVTVIWLVAVAGGAFAAGPVFASLTDNDGPPSLESVHANQLLDAGDQSSGALIGVVRSVDPQSAAVRRAVTATATDLSHIAGVTSVATPYTDGKDLISTSGTELLIQAKLANLSDDALGRAETAVNHRLDTLGSTLATTGSPHATVLFGGDPLLNDQANNQAQSDLSRAEELSLPITLLILIFVFGGIVAASLPVLAAVVSIAGSLGVLLAFSHITSLDSDAVTVITLLGLGLSIDYGLLLVARYREELAAGYAAEEAVGRAWASAGRTILFSGLTVAAALCGMLVFGISGLSALGAAGVSITLVAMLVSLSLTAAMVRFGGRRIKPAKPRANDHGFFAGLARGVQRRPLLVALATGVALLAMGAPLLSMTVHLDTFDGLPRSLSAVNVADIQVSDFRQAPAASVVMVARTTPAALDTWAAGFAHSPDVTRVHPAEDAGHGLSLVAFDSPGGPEGAAGLRLVDATRADRPAGVPSWVTGDAAMHKDLIDLIMRRLPYAVGLTLIVMVVLLFLMTGSVVVPIKAAVMNVLSIGATFGVLNAVFEHGFLAGPLHVLTVSGISPLVIVTVFAFAFGLSMDYEVFLLARIKELVDAGVPNDVAVRTGLQRSGRIITSAALLMVVVFSCFVTGRIGNIQQIGLGLAMAVAIDATLVRCVLVPATMTLLGRANWWAPPFLRRVHERVALTEAPVDERVPELV